MYKSIINIVFRCRCNYLTLEDLCNRIGYNGTRGSFVFRSRVFVLSRSTGAYRHVLKNVDGSIVMEISETFCFVNFANCPFIDVSLLASLCAVIGVVPVNA